MTETKRAPSLRQRANQAIGREAVTALSAAGLSIVDTAELQTYLDETETQVKRLRALVVAATDAAQTRALIFEVFKLPGDGVRFVLCDPSGDEVAMCRRIVSAMGFGEDDVRRTGVDEPIERLGPEEPEQMPLPLDGAG